MRVRGTKKPGWMRTEAGGHWTERNPEAFAYSVGSCFMDAVEERLDGMGKTRSWLVGSLHLKEDIFDRPQRLTLVIASRIARAVGLKAALLAYDDRDPKNLEGPVLGPVLAGTWEAAGRPRDMFAVKDLKKRLRRKA